MRGFLLFIIRQNVSNEASIIYPAQILWKTILF